MRIRIFDIENKKLIPNEYCWTLPELRAVMQEYEDPIPALSFLYYMYDPFSPYANFPEEDKEELIIGDYPGEYTTEDQVIIDAAEKLQKMYETPSKRLLINAKIGMDKLGTYLANNTPTAGRDGDLAQYSMILTRLGKIQSDFKLLEKAVEDENKELKVRGGKDLGYDQM